MKRTRREFISHGLIGAVGAFATMGNRTWASSPTGLPDPSYLEAETTLGEWFIANREDLERVREFIRVKMNELIDMNINTPWLKGPRLPYPYVPVDGAKKWRYMFYWDTYFIIRQLLADGHIEVAKNQVRNYLHLFDRYGYVPNANVYAWATRSQPPLLTSMARLINDAKDDPAFLRECYSCIKREYEDFWLGRLHLVPDAGLSRYQDNGFGTAKLLGHPKNAVTHLAAEAESGWDFTSRFEGRCLDFLPVDLNSFLYKYETDMAWMAERLELGGSESALWSDRAKGRKSIFNDVFWDAQRNFYFDYDFTQKRPSKAWSLAGYLPLWVGLADDEQVRRSHKALARFEQPWGLAVCDHDYAMKNKQWNFPNAWPPLTWWTAESLRTHGYTVDAERIMMKYLAAQTGLFMSTGEIWEKYNSVTGGMEVTGGHEFGNNPMMGWSASTFTDFMEIARTVAEKNKKL
jgi:alpha,alpha-trehalase